nr:hypothetical protein [Vibrio cholerae]
MIRLKGLFNFQYVLERKLRALFYLERVLESKEMLINEDRAKNKGVIVSLTTYSNRINDVHLVIESLGCQTIKPAQILLWLDEEEFNVDTIPECLKMQMERGLTVKFCSNVKSYKKLIPTLKINPDKIIITIDDDVLYPHYFIEKLLNSHCLHPNAIIGYRGHRITWDKKGNFNRYDKWEGEYQGGEESYDILLTGMGGVLYPPHCLHEYTCDESLFLKLAPNADDLWFKVMSILARKKSKIIKPQGEFFMDFISLDTNQDIALFHSNTQNGGNDIQFKKLIERFGLDISYFKDR